MTRRRGRASPGLLTRYLVVGVVIAAVSAVGAFWLSTTTTFAYDQARGERNAASASRIYGALTSYAGTHRTWDEVSPLLLELDARYGIEISLVDARGRTVADSDPSVPHTRADSMVLDPLALGDFGGAEDGLDPRVTGAFQLDAADRTELAARAAAVRSCLGSDVATTSTWRTGRPVVAAPSGAPDCGRAGLDAPVASERRALDALAAATNACLVAHDRPTITGVALELGAPRPPAQLAVELVPEPAASDAAASRACLTGARVEQASRTTAPAIRVDLRDPVLVGADGRELTTGSKARIALVAALVAVLVLAGSGAIALPTLRGVRRLTTAVERFASGDRTVRVGGGGPDEIGRLGLAFDAMSRQIDGNEEERRRMLGDVAHELRSPLTNIRGWLEAARDGVEMEEGEVAAVVLAETLRMQRITSDLLLLAQAETGGLELERDVVDVADVAEEVARAGAPLAASAGVKLTVARAGDTTATTDAGRLRQVLDNLVGNAVRHTPAGGEVRILAREAADGVVVRVEDTGEGIPEAQRARVFERFWRADASRDRREEGSGLGLSIVRALVHALGGSVSVGRSEEGGAAFAVLLPGRRG